MKKTFVLFILLAWSAVYADLAPATFGGVTLTITNNDSVRMKKEEVDIYYQGRYAQVKAVFVMENLTGKTVALDIGFPIIVHGNPETRLKNFGKRKDSLYNFQVHENNRPVNSVVAQKVTQKIPNRMDQNWLWFAWKQNFPPGETVINVEYRIAPSLSYYSYFKNIYYILSTGALWRNHIGKARIAVHFPKAIAREQVTIATIPANFVIKGDTVTWKFRDFEPTEKDNLSLEFIPFWIYDKMQALRTQIKHHPHAVKPRVELARLYFTTFWEKGVGSFLPRELDEKHFNEEVLQKITRSDDRAYFLSGYEKDDKTGFYRPNFEYTKENIPRLNRLIEILSANGYESNDPSTARFKPFMKEAEALLREAIAIDPHSKEARNTCLFYYYQLHYAGFRTDKMGPSSSLIPDKQKKLIRQGYVACPDDPGIRLWMELIDDSKKEIPKYIGELEYLSGSPAWRSPIIFGHMMGFPVDDDQIKCIEQYYELKPVEYYVKINRKNKGYSATTFDMRKADFSPFLNKFLTLFYDRKCFTYELVLKNSTFPPEQKAEIIQLLSRSGFFSFLYSKKILELAKKSGLVSDRNKLYQEIYNSE